MLRLVIFDWDDVITLGSKEGYINCLHQTLADLQVALDPAEEKRRILETWGKPHREELKGLLREKPELLDRACATYETKLFGKVYTNSLSLVPGANEVLKRLATNYILAVATGAHPEILRDKVIPQFNIPNVFSQVISGYDIDNPEKQKPHPYMLQEIMTAQKAKPEETIFVGDAKNDVLMAQSAGVMPVVVLTGHLTRQEAIELGVKNIIDTIADLPALPLMR